MVDKAMLGQFKVAYHHDASVTGGFVLSNGSVGHGHSTEISKLSQAHKRAVSSKKIRNNKKKSK